ncbi:hypothetical protein AYJ54_10920 [Bradyrhizobium centrolobii]|uniref:Uncharacterized protein n=1 Tax=Bradyrhizobium centrolobii TaxID=1505087 RepID=A0A176YS94_9BRAD|nr:hypothetical protein AYJ54_10920 [Bradyrhizobium centrolobii]
MPAAWNPLAANASRPASSSACLVASLDDRIVRERFVFDLSELCAQSGVSTDAVRRKLFGDASQVAA